LVISDLLGPAIAGLAGLQFSAFPSDSGSIVSTETTEVYVDATNGDDNNSGTSADSPLQTIAAVYGRFPLEAFEDAVVNINLAGTGTSDQAVYEVKTLHVGSNRALTSNYSYVGPAFIPIVPTTGDPTGALSSTPGTSVDVNGDVPGLGLIRTRLNVAGTPGWTTDDFIGAYVRITRGGELVIPELPISRNGAATIFVDRLDVTDAVEEDDVVEIVRPAVRIEGPAADFNAFLIRGGYGSVTSFGLAATAQFTRLELFGAVPTLTAGCGFDRCTLSSFIQGFGGAPRFGNCLVDGFFTWDNGAGFEAQKPAGVFLVPDSGEITFASFNGTVSLRGCTGRLGRPIAIWDSPGDALVIMDGTSFYIGTAAVGTDNAGIGIHIVTANCSVRVNGTNSTQLIGDDGALQLSTGAAIDYGTGVGDFEEVLGWNGNFTRVLEGTAAAPTGDASRIYTAE